MQSRGRQMDNFDRTIIKRIAVVLLCTFIFVSFMPAMTYAFEEGQEQLESSVEAADIDAVVKYIMEGDFEGFNLKNADLNGDNKVDAADLVLLIKMLQS